MSDQPDAETPAWQHTTISSDRYPCLWRDSNPIPQTSGCRPMPLTMQPLGLAFLAFSRLQIQFGTQYYNATVQCSKCLFISCLQKSEFSIWKMDEGWEFKTYESQGPPVCDFPLPSSFMSPNADFPGATTESKDISSPCICIMVMFLMRVQRTAISCLLLSIHIFGKIRDFFMFL